MCVSHGFREGFTRFECGSFGEMVCRFACIASSSRAFCTDSVVAAAGSRICLNSSVRN